MQRHPLSKVMELLCKNHSLSDLILIPSFCYGLGFQSRLMGWTLTADRIWCWKLLKEEEVGLGEEPSTFFPCCSPLWCSAPAACGQLVLALLSSWLQSTQVHTGKWNSVDPHVQPHSRSSSPSKLRCPSAEALTPPFQSLLKNFCCDFSSMSRIYGKD